MNVRIGPFLGIAASLCLLVGWCFSMIFVDELHQALHSTPKPVEITAAQLRSYRPGSNLHITLTQFVPYEDGIVVYATPEGDATSIWVPILPADAPRSDPKHIVAVVSLSQISDDDAVDRILARSRWTGLLQSQGILDKAEDIRRFNPGIDVERCWVMREGHRPEDSSGAIFKMIAYPCVFVLGMVLAFLSALRPITAPGESPVPSQYQPIQYRAVEAVGDAVRWLYQRGFFSGRSAILVAAAGLAAAGAGGYVLVRDWDKVVCVTTEMHLALLGGQIGLGLFAFVVFLGLASWWSASAPAPAPCQRIHGADIRADPRNMVGLLMLVGLFLSSIAAGLFLRGTISPWPYVFGALGGLALFCGAIWSSYLRRKTREEPAQFWNQQGPNTANF